MNKNILNNILFNWNNSDIEDSGLLKTSDIKDALNCVCPTVNGHKYKMIKIPDEEFYIGETLVTQSLFITVMGYNPSAYKGGGKYPVENISIDECLTFIDELEKQTGYRGIYLPWESEWEKSIGTGAYKKLFGSKSNGIIKQNIERLKYAWSTMDDTPGGSPLTPKPVGLKLPNEYGIYDLIGNVWEWCQTTGYLRYLAKGHGFNNPVDESTYIDFWDAMQYHKRFNVGFRLAYKS